MISQGGGGIVTDGGLNALPLVLLVEVWTSSPGACSYKYFADRLWGASWGPVAAQNSIATAMVFFGPALKIFILNTTDNFLGFE